MFLFRICHCQDEINPENDFQLVLSDSASDAVSLLLELFYKGKIKFDTKLQFDKVVILAQMMQIQIPTPEFEDIPKLIAAESKIESKPEKEQKSDQKTERKPDPEDPDVELKTDSQQKSNR